MANFRKVTAGQPFQFPAEFYNALVDLVNSGKPAPETTAPSPTAKVGQVGDVYLTTTVTGLGGGWYRGDLVASRDLVADPTTTVPTDPDESAAIPCLIANKAEAGASTHKLTEVIGGAVERSPYPGIVTGWAIDPESEETVPVVSIWALRLKSC